MKFIKKENNLTFLYTICIFLHRKLLLPGFFQLTFVTPKKYCKVEVSSKVFAKKQKTQHRTSKL